MESRTLDPRRLRRYQILLYVAVSALVAGAVSVSWSERAIAAALYLGLGLLSVGIHTLGREARFPRLRAALALVLDLLAHATIVVRLGGLEGPNPYVLLLALPILTWGLLSGFLGGLAAAFGTASLLVGRFAFLQQTNPEMVEVVESWEAVALRVVSFLLLGVFAALLGQRIGEDRAAHEKTQRELEQVQLDAESIVASFASGLVCLDDEGRIRRLNWNAKVLLGIDRWIDFGTPVRSMLTSSHWMAVTDFLETCLARGEERVREFPFTRNGRTWPLEVATLPIWGPNGEVRGLTVLLSDVSERRAKEAEEKRNERLALIGQLSAGLAHEIRNSLKPITGSVELLRAEPSAHDGSMASLMDIILREAENLENFLTEFLSFARDKTLTVEPISLERIVGEECESLRALDAHPIRYLGPESSSREPVIMADRSAVGQVIRNLGMNAIDASRGSPGEVEIGWLEDGEEVEIFVRDHGSGVSSDVLERVFDPFFTTKSSGTGLGLAIARDLVERMGGRIRLQPASEGGVRASVRFPRAGGLAGEETAVEAA